MHVAHPIDGSLPAWSEVEHAADWQALLVGNGMSVNVWSGFAYRSLYEKARAGRLLGSADDRLFERFGTENFETVLARLNTAIEALVALGGDIRVLDQRRRSIRAALGATIHAVHIQRINIEDDALHRIKQVMLGHRCVFTTNYDLLAYWAMGCEESYGLLVDLFWSNSAHGGCAFDPDNATVRPGWVPIYYLHGALHLIVWADGTTQKLRRTGMQTILDQFARERGSQPLLVTEGTAAEKQAVIAGNMYLSRAFEELRRCRLPLVVFGSSLGDGDGHLVEAINLDPRRPVAVSMLPGRDPIETIARQGDIRARLHATQLYFFDATTHPLGASTVGATPLIGVAA
jgi:hypothetical protein